MVPLYIRYMGIESYGLVGFYTTLTSILSVLDLGIGATLNRQLAKSNSLVDNIVYKRNLVRTFEVLYWVISIISGILIFFLAPIISEYWIISESFSRDNIISTIKFMGIAFALQFPISLYQGGLLGLQKYMLLNLLLIFVSVIRNIGVLIFIIYYDSSINTFFKGQSFFSLLASVSFMISIWIVIPKNEIKPKFSKNIIKDNWRFALTVSASSIIGVVLSQLDKVILTKMLPIKLFAYYSIASTVASAVWMCIIPFNTAIFPKLVQLYENKSSIELKFFFHKSSQLLSLILLPICSILIIYSEQVLAIWIKDSEVVENSHHIVSLLVFGIMLNGLVSLPVNCATAFGWPSLVTYTNLIQAIFIVPLIILLVYFFQASGAAIAWVIMNSTYIIFTVPLFFKKYLMEEKFKWYLYDILIPLVISFSVSFFFYLLFSLVGRYNTFIILFIIGFLSLIVTTFSLSQIRNQLLIKLKRYISRISL